MNREMETGLLQAIVAIASLVPLTMGAASLIWGPAILSGVEDPVPRDLDSHFRYLSGIFLLVGCGFVSCVHRIERKRVRFRLFGALVIAGGLGRALSLLEYGLPSTGHQLALVIELGVVPLLLVWQTRIARLYRQR